MIKLSKLATAFSMLGLSATVFASGSMMQANAAARTEQHTYTLACKVAHSDVTTQIDITNLSTNSAAKGSGVHWQVTGGGGSGIETLASPLSNQAPSNSIRVWVNAAPPAAGMGCTAWFKA